MMIRRLNWGCGPCPAAGWSNADRVGADGVQIVHDIRDGLPGRDGAFDYAVAVHAVQDLPYPDVVPALRELRRTLRSGGALRLALPDLDRAMAAYAASDHGYFYVPDADAKSIGGKRVAQIVWYGSVRTPFTFDAIDELLRRADFTDVWRADDGQTHTRWTEIVSLDNRPRESLFVEAVRAA